MMQISIRCEIKSFLSTIFPKVEARLQKRKYAQSIQHVANRKKLDAYAHIVDFMFCEFFGEPWKYRCQQYYEGDGPLLKEYMSKKEISNCEKIMLIALDVAASLHKRNYKTNWSEYKMIARNIVLDSSELAA